MKKATYLFLILSTGLLAACSDQQAPPPAAAAKTPAAAKTQGNMHHPIPKITEPPKREYSFSDVTEGGKLFRENCAACHGQQAQGQQAVAGKPPAPPLNGTGHAWHHPKIRLMQTIMQGTVSKGGNMPSWKDKLSEKQIEQVIAWMQSRWRDEIYAAWLQTEKKARNSIPRR